jgi:hypothetical protein
MRMIYIVFSLALQRMQGEFCRRHAAPDLKRRCLQVEDLASSARESHIELDLIRMASHMKNTPRPGTRQVVGQ